MTARQLLVFSNTNNSRNIRQNPKLLLDMSFEPRYFFMKKMKLKNLVGLSNLVSAYLLTTQLKFVILVIITTFQLYTVSKCRAGP
jgi:hypothetical protein